MKIFENFINEIASNSDLEPVIAFMGKFQPFHNGHLESLQAVHKEYNLPIYLFYSNSKKRHISYDLTKRIMDTVKNNNKDLIVKCKPISQGSVVKMLEEIKADGYYMQYMACGSDRVEDYENQIKRIKSGKYANDGIICDPNLEVINAQLLSNNDLHATELRDKIKLEARDFYEENTPEYLHLYFDELHVELNEKI